MQLQLAIFTAVMGLSLMLYGIYRIHHLKESRLDAIASGSHSGTGLSRLKWVYILLTMLGMASVWGSAATTVSVPASATITVKALQSGRMVLGIDVKKQRDCPMDTLTAELFYQSGRREILIIDYASDPGSNVLETVVKREDESPVVRVSFRATYMCPFGIQVDSVLGSIKPPADFNLVVP